jgi:exodeoxyribonuclease VII small subunit
VAEHGRNGGTPIDAVLAIAEENRMPEAATPVADLPFEKALAELESIVQRLEQGKVDLEESIAIYERGEALKSHCERLLKEAEGRVERIRLGGNGKPAGTEPLDDDAPF